MPVNWGLGLQQGPNAGESFANSFQQGMQANRQRMGQNALAQLVQNPNDPQALSALAQAAPEVAMQFQQQRSQMLMQHAEQYKQAVLDGVPLYQKMGAPQDDMGWQRFKIEMAKTGHDVSQMPDHFDPQYIAGATQMYQAWTKPDEPGPIREFHQAIEQKLLPANTTYEQFLQMKNPGMVSPVTVPYGAQVVAGGAQGGQSVPHVSDQASYDAIPAGSQYQTPDGHIRVKGGAGGNASGGFR